MEMAFPESFVTARLEADRLTPDHLAEVRRMHQDPAVMAHLGGVREEHQTVAYLERNLRHWADSGFGLWILRERGGTDPIGRAVLRHLRVDDRDEVEVGYAFYSDYWGRGLATEVTIACLGFGFRELGLTTIVAVTNPANVASQRVLVKAGLVYERELNHEGSTWSLFRIHGDGMHDQANPSASRADALITE
jgi:RimJ/RimL family protein N-acetyltransferase